VSKPVFDNGSQSRLERTRKELILMILPAIDAAKLAGSGGHDGYSQDSLVGYVLKLLATRGLVFLFRATDENPVSVQVFDHVRLEL
jgi:hypothetical protein